MTSTSARERILLVEDDLDIRDTLSEVLTFEGYSVDMAASGLEALKMLEQGPLTHVILLDFMMPGINGFEFRERQRKNPAWSAIPVIVLSADRNTAAEAEAIGAAGALRKPLDIDRLLEMLTRVCAASPQAAPATDGAPTIPRF